MYNTKVMLLRNSHNIKLVIKCIYNKLIRIININIMIRSIIYIRKVIHMLAYTIVCNNTFRSH